MPSTRKSAWGRFFGSRWFLVAAIAAACLIIFAYARAYYQDYQVRKEIAKLQAEARSLEGKKLHLLDVLKYVQSDTFVEERARQELNMIRPGEQVAVVTAPAMQTERRQPSETVVGLDRFPNYLKWWRYFIKGER